jgi:hypothetical protein
MNISRLDSVATPGHIHRTEKHGARTAVENPAAQLASEPQDGMSPRLANYTAQVDARIANAVATTKLTPRQLSALEDAKTKFHSMMERLDAAFGGEEGVQGKASGALANILDLMSESVGSILAQSKDARPTKQRAELGDDNVRANRLRADVTAKAHPTKIDKLA